MHGVPVFDCINIEVGGILDRRIYVGRNPAMPQQFRLDGSLAKRRHSLITKGGYCPCYIKQPKYIGRRLYSDLRKI